MALSEKALKAAAAEVNKLGVDPPIDLKSGIRKITAGLKEAIADVLEDDDEFTEETEAVLIELGWKEDAEEEEEEAEEVEDDDDDDEEVEEEDEDEETEEEDEEVEEEDETPEEVAEKLHQKNIAGKGVTVKADTAPSSKGKAKPETAPKEKRKPPQRKTGSYTRIDAVCDALQTKKPKTVKDWVKATNDVYIEKGGSANDSESTMMIKYAMKVLTHFDVKFPAE